MAPSVSNEFVNKILILFAWINRIEIIIFR